MKINFKTILLCSLFLIFSTALVYAQFPTAVVDLEFGNILTGVPKVIAKTDAGKAAEFTVSGSAGAEITIDFILPAYMYAGNKTMRLVFSQTDCSMDSSSTPDQSNPPFNDQNPWRTMTYGIGANGLTIWLGGLVMPDVNQPSGSYTAPLTIQIAYTGN